MTTSSDTPAKITGAGLDPALVGYLVDCRARGHREATIKVRRDLLKRLSAHVDGRSLLELTNDDVYGFYLGFRKLSAASRFHYGMSLRSFYRWAEDRQMITENPTKGLPIPRADQKKPRPISANDLHRALQAADPRMRLWIMLGAGAGLRAGEIARLNREDVDTDHSPPAIEVVNGKGGKDRTVTIGDNLAVELKAWRVRFGRMWRVSPETVSAQVNAHFKRLDIGATCHALRHTYASTLYVQSGSDIRLVQEMLGHVSLKSTQVYTAFEPRRAVEAIDVVDQLLADAAALPLEARQRVAAALARLEQERDQPPAGAA